MMTMKSRLLQIRTWLTMCALAVLLYSCEKEVELIIPPAENKYVIEGTIENGQPPFVLISQTKDYNQAISASSFNGFYLGGATVVVTNNGVRDTLQEICVGDLPQELLEQVIELTGISPGLLVGANVCGYLDLDGSTSGIPNQTYGLEVTINDETFTSSTSIPGLISLDSLWFEVAGDDPVDSLGFAYATITDPDTVGNAYRWFAKRINTYPAWADKAGEQKDNQFIAPLGSSYDDSFFNGLNFEFAYYRGSLIGSDKDDDFNEERGFFKLGDTVAVRGTHIDRDTYNYVVSFEAEAGSAGNPFTAPSPIYTNIQGGAIGVWAGYAAQYDTLIAVP
ncbi:MAG: DUF4249 family protein [Flavobacteriales bacterium]